MPSTGARSTPRQMPEKPAAALCLQSSLDLTRADSLHATLITSFEQDGPLTIDGSTVERVSTACIQLLVAAALKARDHDRPFSLHKPSAVLAQAVRDLGLASFLGLEPA
jgi:chemotaxis protein CheX